MEILKLLALFIGGILTGLYASNVGGGSLITFPLLILFGLPTNTAIATNRLSAVLLEFSSSIKFYKEKKLDLKLGLGLGVAAAIGSYIGSSIIIKINEEYLNTIIAIVFLVLFIVLYNKDRLGIREKEVNEKNLVAIYFFTFLLGIYGGFFGGGFGTFIMFILVFSGFTFIKSAAIGRVVGFIMSLTAAIVFANSGLVNYLYGISMGLGCAIGSWFGIGIAIKQGNKYIKTLFIIIIILTIIKMLAKVIF